MKGLAYRSPVGDKPGTFADWLRCLSKQSGAYVIRSRNTKQILYVGESHTGRLYDAVRHHFVPRSKPGLFFGTPLTEYKCSRDAVEVAVRVTPQGSAIGAQNNLIARLRPKHNVNGQPEEPF